VPFRQRNLWLSQALIAELFQKDVRTVNEHLQNIFAEGKLDSRATIRKFRIVRHRGDVFSVTDRRVSLTNLLASDGLVERWSAGSVTCPFCWAASPPF